MVRWRADFALVRATGNIMTKYGSTYLGNLLIFVLDVILLPVSAGCFVKIIDVDILVLVQLHIKDNRMHFFT